MWTRVRVASPEPLWVLPGTRWARPGPQRLGQPLPGRFRPRGVGAACESDAACRAGPTSEKDISPVSAVDGRRSVAATRGTALAGREFVGVNRWLGRPLWRMHTFGRTWAAEHGSLKCLRFRRHFERAPWRSWSAWTRAATQQTVHHYSEEGSMRSEKIMVFNTLRVTGCLIARNHHDALSAWTNPSVRAARVSGWARGHWGLSAAGL